MEENAARSARQETTEQDDARPAQGRPQSPNPAEESAVGVPDADGAPKDVVVEEDGPFAAVRARLDEIAQEVGREDISLDAALDLYEEAVKLGTEATDLLEERMS